MNEWDIRSDTEVRCKTKRVLAAMNDTDTHGSELLLQTIGTHDSKVLGIDFGREQQASALHRSDNLGEVARKFAELGQQLLSTSNNVLANLGSHHAQHSSTDLTATRIGGHGVAVQATHIGVRSNLAERKNRNRELATIDGLGERLEIWWVQITEIRVVRDTQNSLATKTSLTSRLCQ
jgi:hypothetical protein